MDYRTSPERSTKRKRKHMQVEGRAGDEDSRAWKPNRSKHVQHNLQRVGREDSRWYDREKHQKDKHTPLRAERNDEDETPRMVRAYTVERQGKDNAVRTIAFEEGIAKETVKSWQRGCQYL